MIELIVCVALGFGIYLLVRARGRRDIWRGDAPHGEPLTYLNAAMAIRPSVLGHGVPDGYRHACAFFGVGLIDRTGTLDHGFPVEITDPVPQDFEQAKGPIAPLVTERAEALVAEARGRGMGLRLLWSGGIDSTCAAVALLEALKGDEGVLEIAYTDDSVTEYPAFRDLLESRGARMLKIGRIGEALMDDALIVTGEHGDQLFGSMLAADLSTDDLFSPWPSVIEKMMTDKLGKTGAQSALAYVAPQTQACPIPVETAFDWLWWANFSMKWQAVAERMLAPLSPEHREAARPVLRHFFRTDDFQRWSLANPDGKIRRDWASYKYPLKEIIHGATQDARYRDEKVKERSLRALLEGRPARAIALTAGGLLLAQLIDRSILAGAPDRSAFEGFADFGE